MILDNGTAKISASSFKNLTNIWSILAALLISNTAFKIQVLSTSATKCRGDFKIFQFASAIRRQKMPFCCRLNRSLCILNRQWRRHTSAFCQGLWFNFLPVENTCSAWIIKFTYNSLQLVKRKTILSLVITLFWFFCLFL